MNTNPYTVCMDSRALRRALRALRTGAVIQADHPLLTLRPVEALLAGRFAEGRAAQTWALGQVLTGQITAGLSRQRALVGLLLPDADEPLSEARRAIIRDSQQLNPELIGWSWLHYHYVRVDLNIDAGAYAEWANVKPRTLRRVQARALTRLGERLIEAERVDWARS